MDDNFFPITENIFLEISEFRGQKRVDIRKWFMIASGEWKRTNKGINLSIEEWNNFAAQVSDMKEFVEAHI